MTRLRMRYLRWSLGLVALLVLTTEGALAMNGDEDDPPGSPGVLGLPAWAEPESGGRYAPEGGTVMNHEPGHPPPFPPDPEPVPVDGGLGVLLAAGAGYAVRRLRQGRRQDER